MEGALIITYDESYQDTPTLVVARKERNRIKVLNTIQGDSARGVYHYLTGDAKPTDYNLTDILANQLLKTDWGHCYMCTNPMKNITLDGVNNGCDGECRMDDNFSADDLIKKIAMEMAIRNEQRFGD